MIEFNSRKLNIKVDGEAFKLSYPSVDQLKVHERAVSNATRDKDGFAVIEHVQKFLAVLGLPVKVSGKMEAGQLTELTHEVCGTKKK